MELMTTTPKHSRTTLIRMAACEAVGLHYWAGHPLPGRVWAVDDQQQAHVVRVYLDKANTFRDGTASIQRVYEVTTGHRRAYTGAFAYEWVPVVEPRTADDGPRVPFAVTDATPALFAA